jgi:hypothetical protein
MPVLEISATGSGPARGLEQYASNMTGGKILLLPLTKEAE